MKFELEQYKDRKYIKYTDESKDLVFNNAEYFMIDIRSEVFTEIMNHTGGFCANMTTRFIEKHNLNAAYILFCCIPQKFNDFIFKFVYLDENYHILTHTPDDNYFDYSYFKKKFKDCICKEGWIFELEPIETLKEITQEFEPNPSVEFNLLVENHTVSFNDILLCRVFDFFEEDIRSNLERLNAKYCEFHFDSNYLNFITLQGFIIGDDNNVLKSYQVRSGFKTKTEYVEYMKQKHEDYTEEDVSDTEFEFNISVDFARKIQDSLYFKER